MVLVVGSLLGTSTATAESEPEAVRASPSNPWRPVFYASLGATVAVMGFSAYARLRMRDEAEQVPPGILGSSLLSSEDCNDGSITADAGGHFRAACRWHSRHKTSAYFGMGLVGITVAAAYLAFFASDDGDDPRLTVAPAVTPESAGAAMLVRW